MKRPWLALTGTVWLLIVMVVGWGVVGAADPALDTAKIEQLTGAKGDLNTQEGVFKVNVPRTDLAVTAAGVKMTPPMGLTSWAAFQPMGTQTMVMGDKCLFKINFILITKSLDDPFNILNQGCKIRICPKLDPFILHKAPKDLNKAQLRGIFRQIEYR